jgi:hypothetical protein
MPESADIEDLIERLDQICSARESLYALGVGESSYLDGAGTVQAEVEWYVQHVCERLAPESATLQWGSVLLKYSDHKLVLATTNYDRAVELAANSLDIKLADGFAPFGRNEYAPWVGFPSASAPFDEDRISLLKLHGSTDWYEKVETGEPAKLRHPMPLFAGGSLVLPGGQTLNASLILPSREKRMTRSPYLRLYQIFLNAVDQCDLAVFLGTSLRDPHIRQAALDSSAARPTFLVNRGGPPDSVSGVVQHIAQTASQFLISTLPYALGTADPISTLNEYVGAGASSGVQSLIVLLSGAMDASLTAHDRCRSIEELERANLPLVPRHVESLMRDEDPLVARFALGLVPLATEGESLQDLARRIAASTSDPRYQEEVDLLGRLLQKR